MYNEAVGNPSAGGRAGAPAPRNRKLDVYKGLLIVLVVFRHVLQYSVADGGGILTNFIWAVQMPGFMLVAGYFSARRIGSLAEAGRRILLSAQHYALPFFSWCLLISCLLSGRYNRNPVTAALTLLTHVDGGLWFLWVAFVLSVIATLCNLTLFSPRGRIIKTGAVLIGCFGILLALGKAFGLNFLGIKFIFYYAIFYGFGWLAHQTEDRWRKWWPKVQNTAVFLAIIAFLAIVYNYDLYHAPDNLTGIALRCIAGYTGNLVLLWCCARYEAILSRLRLDRLGVYTLEIYATHMYVVGNLMTAGNANGFFTVLGFANFLISLVLTALFTGIIIAVFKSIPAMDFVFYGKKQKGSNGG